MGAALLLVGLVAAAITSPLFDRVFTNHLAISCKAVVPVQAACWIALIWESACIYPPGYYQVPNLSLQSSPTTKSFSS